MPAWLSSINFGSFSFRDLIGQDKWEAWTPVPVGMTEVGTATYYGRHRKVGAQRFFQITIVAGTTTASTAGTTYFPLPTASKGYAAMANAYDATALTPIDVCAIAISDSRCYTPTWVATGNVIKIAGWYEE